METQLITVKLTQLIGNNVSGLKAQVRNPIYLNPDDKHRLDPMWRTLKKVKTFKERGKEWVELHWEFGNGIDESCSFTGCTIESNVCAIQFTQEEFLKLKTA